MKVKLGGGFDCDGKTNAAAHLLEEAVLLVGDGCGRLRKLTPFLPQAGPHVFFLEQRVELSQRVQNLLEQKKIKGNFERLFRPKENESSAMFVFTSERKHCEPLQNLNFKSHMELSRVFFFLDEKRPKTV